MLIFGASVNCIPWVYAPEILPLHARAKGQALSVSANWLWNFFVVMITPTLIEDLAWKGYLVFMALNFVFVPVRVLSPCCGEWKLINIACLLLLPRDGQFDPRGD